MRNFKKIFLCAIVLVVIGIGLFFARSEKTLISNASVNLLTERQDTENNSGDDVILPKMSQNAEKILPVEHTAGQNKAGNDFSNKIKVFISIGDKKNDFFIPGGSTVYEAMVLLSASTTADFNFKAKEYSGIGYFIEEINGVKNAGGKYWTLYVNGKYAMVGVSDYKLSAGDKVEWRYE